MRLLIDIVGFQITWWAAALGAAAGRWEPGLAAGAAVVLIQLAVSTTRAATLAAVLTAGLVGFVAEAAIVASGLVRYGAAWPLPGLPPVWLIALWMVFGTCIGATASMLGERPLLKGALLGAIVAPPTYWAGERIAALSLAEPRWLPLAAIAVVWAIATPLMLAAYQKAAPRA